MEPASSVNKENFDKYVVSIVDDKIQYDNYETLAKFDLSGKNILFSHLADGIMYFYEQRGGKYNGAEANCQRFIVDVLMKVLADENDNNTDESLLKSAKTKKAAKNALLEFEKDTVPYRVDIKKYEPEPIPEGWDPFKRVKEFLSKGNTAPSGMKTQRYQQLDPKKREAMLADEKDILEEKLATISEETRKRIANVKTFVRGETQSMGGDDLDLIFHGDKNKIERYKNFCWEKLGKLVSGIPPGNMTYQDLVKEKEEFERIYQTQQQERANQTEQPKFEKPMTEEEKKQAELLQKIDELKKNIQKERGKRRVEYWQPDKILCRRFNVPQPKVDRNMEDAQDREDKFYEQILPAFLGNKGKEVPREPKEIKPKAAPIRGEDMPVKEFRSNKLDREQAFQQRDEEEQMEEESEEEPGEDVVTEERPPMELFQSIFGDEES